MEAISLPLSPNLSPTSSPYITAPSSPKHPADEVDELKSSLEADNNDDITFEFCVDRFQSFSLPAEELFEDGKFRTLKPPLSTQPERAHSGRLSISESKRKIVWWSRHSYDLSEGNTTLSFGGTKTTSKLNKLINILTFRRPSPERGSNSSKGSTGFGSTGSSSSGWGTTYMSGSVHEPDDGYGIVGKQVKSCFTPCKQRLLSCFVKKL